MSLMKKTMEFFVHTKDVDFNDVIRPTAILDMFQDLAGLHAEELGVGYLDLKEKNYAWVVLYQQYEIKKLPPYLERVDLVTWPKPKSRLEFEREYLLKNKEGDTLVQGISNWVIIDLNTRGLVRSDKINFNGEYEAFTNYPEKCKRKLSLDANLITDEFTYEVTLEDIDHNGHMNNARYINIIQNQIFSYGSKSYIKDVEISYVKEAKHKDKIRIGHFKVEDKDALIGFVENDVCFECLIGVEEL
ncbi:MAG: hypothetical protein K2J85_04070 [Anaeroplasmataceae bacterium]|nr:hypothetical protein [Anaeroplasmataceae bacterium]